MVLMYVRERPSLAGGEVFSGVHQVVGSRRLEPKSTAKSPAQQKEQGTAVLWQRCWLEYGCLLGYLRSFSAAAESEGVCWKGKATGTKIYFVTAFRMHMVCVWLSLCRKEG